ncbi:unnamed protein product [Symbiodinium pilosum]|uniref:3-beta hydroxysteroid dehydrogenase/isomerase domain-containing protein n=1 Tax=Symbiodinium pilosum TaxID=2952 RepID=A0A812IS14_SYMPI|nr:unnamed protein product [Symbiodinium pilosum]
MANNEQHFRKHWILGVEVLLRPVLARTDQILIVQVSSFAACNHWVPHHNVAESDPAATPPLTSLRSPYDLSKAMTEQFILQKHSASGMRTVSIRIGGVYGDNDDQYWNRRLPFRLSLDISCDADANPPKIDANYVENVAEGLLRVSDRLSADASVGGRFYFYTIGERHATQQELGYRLAEATGRFHLAAPTWVIHVWLAVMSFLVSFHYQLPSWPLNQPAGRVVEPKSYFNTYSMAKKGLIDQWFDNSLFRKTFGYSHIYTTEEAVALVAGAAKRQPSPRYTDSHKKRPGTMTLVAGPVLISLCTMVLVVLCGGLSLSVACSTSWSLCSLCQFGFFVSSPATHVCGFVTQPAYRLWMPFQGGSLHVFLQGIGWSCFALLLMQWPRPQSMLHDTSTIVLRIVHPVLSTEKGGRSRLCLVRFGLSSAGGSGLPCISGVQTGMARRCCGQSFLAVEEWPASPSRY